MTGELADIDARVRGVLSQRVRFTRAADVDPGASLLDLGLDSTAIMSLVVGLEEEFDLEVPDQEITLDHFGTVGAITRYVAGRGSP